MNIRPITVFDLNKLKLAHEEYFAKEFDFPDLRKFYSAFIVENKDGEMISAGGVRPISEAIIITDMSKSVKERREALYQLFQAMLFTNSKLGFDQLHAFVQDETWLKHLIKVGFRPTTGKALVIG